MQLWLVLFLSIALFAVILTLARVLFEVDLRARGNPDGTWFGVLGAALGPFALAVVGARGAPPRLELYCLGRRVWAYRRKRATRRPLGDSPASASSEEAEAATKPRSRVRERALRWFGTSPLELEQHAEFALGLERYLAVDTLVVNVAFGFHDVALTGKVMAALAVLSGVLPRSVSLVQTPLWEGEERWELGGKGKIGLWPGRVLLEVLWYMLVLRWPKRTSPRSLEAS